LSLLLTGQGLFIPVRRRKERKIHLEKHKNPRGKGKTSQDTRIDGKLLPARKSPKKEEEPKPKKRKIERESLQSSALKSLQKKEKKTMKFIRKHWFEIFMLILIIGVLLCGIVFASKPLTPYTPTVGIPHEVRHGAKN
jgi:hypothetical protein